MTAPSAGLLGVDIGTSSCKAVLVDKDGALIASASAGYPLSAPQEGWAEQDPENWARGVRESVFRVRAKAPGTQITAVGLSGQMHGLAALDANDAVIRPAILWNDQRNAAECAQITRAAGGLRTLLELTGNPMLPGYTGGKIVWLREHEPHNYDKLAVALNPKDYVRLRLTGEHATEVSDASGTGLFDVRHRCWSTELLAKLDISADILPACYESEEISGWISRAAADEFSIPAGVPVVGGGGDAVIQTLGSGVVSPGTLQTTIGTAGIVAAALDAPVDNEDGLLQVFCNVARRKWHCMGVALNAGGALAWLRGILAKTASGEGAAGFDSLISRAEMVEPGSGGLLFLPYLAGERCPWPDPDARGAFIGLRTGHDAGHMTRSVLEGVVFALRDIRLLMERAGCGKAARLHSSGGGATAGLWNQILADIFDNEVLTVRGAAEGGAFGAALLAGVGCGVWSRIDEAAKACATEHIWSPDAANAARYTELFATYRQLYPSLREIFHRQSSDVKKRRTVV